MENVGKNVELDAILQAAINEAKKGVGKLCILVAGKTGVGKSTLINTVFRGDFAKTGSGRPVTQEIEEISKPGHPLTIIDTKGLELEDYAKIKADLEAEIKRRAASENANEHVHLAWVCVQSVADRVEEAEISLCKFIKELNIPLIVVVTKSKKNDPFVAKVRELIPQANYVLGVRAIEEYVEELESSLPMIGLDDLIGKTADLLPEAQARAYSNALSTKNKRALAEKIKRAEMEVNGAAALAGAAAATPIPFSDAFTLVPIQVGMLAKIGSTFGMEMTTTAITTIVTGALGGSAATLVGRALVSGVLKLIPGAGSVVGGTIAATTATALTKSLGNIYVAVLTDFCEKNPGVPIDVQHISAELKKRFSF
ncbi:MAG: GTPase [Clostridia bacterium]